MDKLFGADAAAAVVPFAFSFFAPSLVPVSRTDWVVLAGRVVSRSGGGIHSVQAGGGVALAPKDTEASPAGGAVRIS